MGKLICIEGADCVGKTTQCNLLMKHLESQGKKAAFIHFPNYETPIGAFIGNLLSGQVKGFEDLNFEAFQMLYVADQINLRPKIERMLEENDYVICDRYYLSTLVYLCAKLNLDYQNDKIVHAFKQAQMLIRKADITFVLHCSDDNVLSDRLLNKDRDKLEAECDFILKINSIYRKLTISLALLKEIKGFVVYAGNKTPESISNLIIKAIDTEGI